MSERCHTPFGKNDSLIRALMCRPLLTTSTGGDSFADSAARYLPRTAALQAESNAHLSFSGRDEILQRSLDAALALHERTCIPVGDKKSDDDQEKVPPTQ